MERAEGATLNREVKDLIKKLHRLGFDVEPTRDGHHKVRYRGTYIYTLPGSPSDHRWYKNFRSVFRRLTGLDLDS